jgi:hypothetical protein
VKRTIKSVLSFALLGALIGVCMPLFVYPADSMTLGLPYWINVSPAVGVLILSIPFGLFIGALTGLASAFASGRFASVRCLLAIAVPAVLAAYSVAPEVRKDTETWLWTPHVVFVIVATIMAILIASVGYGQRRATSTGSSSLLPAEDQGQAVSIASPSRHRLEPALVDKRISEN